MDWQWQTFCRLIHFFSIENDELHFKKKVLIELVWAKKLKFNMSMSEIIEIMYFYLTIHWIALEIDQTVTI